MAASLGSAHLTTALAPALASAKSPHSKATEAKGSPDERTQSSRDFNPPPPKKVRVEERSVKPKKLSRDGGVGGNGSGREKLQQPAKSCGSGSWSVSPAKSSSISSGSGNAPSVPASQPSTHTHKLFKQSDFFLHKAPSSSKPKKPSKDKQRERDKSKVAEEKEEKKKHKLFANAVPAGINVTNNNISSDISRFNNSSAPKRENGEVTSLPKGRPS